MLFLHVLKTGAHAAADCSPMHKHSKCVIAALGSPTAY